MVYGWFYYKAGLYYASYLQTINDAKEKKKISEKHGKMKKAVINFCSMIPNEKE